MIKCITKIIMVKSVIQNLKGQMTIYEIMAKIFIFTIKIMQNYNWINNRKK